jgi:hypothetical protein
MFASLPTGRLAPNRYYDRTARAVPLLRAGSLRCSALTQAPFHGVRIREMDVSRNTRYDRNSEAGYRKPSGVIRVSCDDEATEEE